jgi:hypothetical protein
LTRQDYINRWMQDCEPKHRSILLPMLNCLTEIELMRPYLVKDRERGMSFSQIAIKYAIGESFVKYQISKVKKMSSQNETTFY